MQPRPRTHLTSSEGRDRGKRMAVSSDKLHNGVEPQPESDGSTAASQLPRMVGAIPGPNSRQIFEAEQYHIAPGRQRISLLAGLALDHGEGATLTDADGNVYVDFVAGIGVASLGHAHPALVNALAGQAGRLMVGTFATAERAEALRLLTEVAPPNLTR